MTRNFPRTTTANTTKVSHYHNRPDTLAVISAAAAKNAARQAIPNHWRVTTLDELPRQVAAFQIGLRDALSRTIEYLPSLIAAVLIIIAGWIIARIARSLTKRVGNDVNRFLERAFRHGSLASARLSTGALAVLAEIAFWLILFVAITIAARTAGLTGVSAWLSQIVAHLPNLLIGAAIIAAGYFVSVLIGEQVSATTQAANAGRSALMGKLAQWGIFVTALIIGLDQIGVNVTFLVALFAVTVGSVAVGLSIAFGLGAREFAGNLIGARSARRELSPGQVVRTADVEGEILEISPTHIILETADGKALLPGRLTLAQHIVVVSPDVADGENE